MHIDHSEYTILLADDSISNLEKLKSLLESASIQPPVVVEMRDGTASITLHLMMQFGARIPSVAEKVQENVKSAVQNMTNVTVSRVDLVIAGLAEAQ